LSKFGELRKEETCGRILDIDSKPYAQVQMSDCNNEKSEKEWILTEVLY